MDPRLGAAVRAAADALGVTAAEWVRQQLAHLADLPLEGRVVRAYRNARPPAPHQLIEIARLREVVAALGGSLTQAAIRTPEAGKETLHAEIEAALPDVKSAVRDLDALKRAMLDEDRQP
jgi:hypothetical protein